MKLTETEKEHHMFILENTPLVPPLHNKKVSFVKFANINEYIVSLNTAIKETKGVGTKKNAIMEPIELALY